MTVPRPRIDYVRRQVPGAATVGDSAVARLEPGLVELLTQRFPEARIAAPEYILPTGIATSAAVAILAPAQVDGLYWAGRDAEYNWSNPAAPGDIVLGEARLTSLNERSARFAVSGRTDTGKKLFEGALHMLAMREGRPIGYANASQFEAMRSRLAAARRTPAEQGRRLTLVSATRSIPLGKQGIIEVDVAGQPAEVELVLPYGAGLSAETTRVTGGRVAFTITADRPHEVNLSRPWVVEIRAAGESLSVPVAVPDPEPGRVYYILTEDCETFDGGSRTGDYKELAALGNQNNFMDPEDYRVQMIEKPDRMNEIAERHGARWTHFWCAPQRFAAEWAAGRSETGAWRRIADALDESIRRGSWLHEYAPHIHFDYEPDSPVPPQPRLIYNRATDGILPNQYYDPVTNPTHCYHDWDGSARGIAYLKALGDWTDVSSKAGSLRKSLQYLARMQAGRRALLVARTGSHDFGKAAEDQATSTKAYLANGLWGNSDAYRHAAPPTPGGQMFWCSERDRQQPITDLSKARLVQMGITLDTMFRREEELNQWFARHWPSCQGPGVHALLFTTHAMFMRGEPDPFRSLDGGAFAVLDRHLAWVRANYPQARFATASEAVLEFLDYYTPVLRAFVEPRPSGPGQYPVRLLGRGIRVSPAHPATVAIAAPVCFAPEEIAELRVVAGGRVLASQHEFDRRVQPSIAVTLCDRDTPLCLEVHAHPVAQAFSLCFHDPPELPQPDLFRPSDVIRLLMNPIAGHSEPLGRRVHPLGSVLVGYALTAAARPGTIPESIKLRWVKPIAIDATITPETQPDPSGAVKVNLRDEWGEVVMEAEVRLREASPAPAAPHQPDIQAEFDQALAVYRAQRAWKVMLFVRKAYALLHAGRWGEFAKWLWRMATGKGAGLEEYELKFPRVD